MVKTRDPTCCWDIFNTKGRSEEMLLRMFGEEEGVAVVRNDSNNVSTPYIPLKGPSTLPLNSARTTNKHITAQPFHQKNSHALNNSNNRNTIRNPYLALPINHHPSKYPCTSNTTILQNNNQLRFMQATFNPELTEKQQPIKSKVFLK